MGNPIYGGCPYQAEDGFNDRNRFPHGHLFVGEIENGKRYPLACYTKEESDTLFASKSVEEDKADRSDLDALSNEIDSKADQSALDSITAAVNGVTSEVIEARTSDVSGVSFDSISDRLNSAEFYVTPEMFGAVGDGITDDTAAFASMISSSAKTFVFGNKTYAIGSIVIPESSTIIANCTTLKRLTHNGAAFVSVYENSCVYGNLTIDGDKEHTVELEDGIVFEESCKAEKIESKNCSRRGIIVKSNSSFDLLVGHNNGITGTSAGDGKADGIYVINAIDVSINLAIAYENKRNGVTVTTYNGSGKDKTLSNNVNIGAIVSHDNIYVDVDVEGANGVHIDSIQSTGSFAASGSDNCVFRNVKAEKFYANNSSNVVCENFELYPSGASTNIFYINGQNNRVSHIHCLDTADSYSSNAFQVTDLSGESVVSDIIIDKAYNGFSINHAHSVTNIIVNDYINRYGTINLVPVDPKDSIVFYNSKCYDLNMLNTKYKAPISESVQSIKLEFSKTFGCALIIGRKANDIVLDVISLRSNSVVVLHLGSYSEINYTFVDSYNVSIEIPDSTIFEISANIEINITNNDDDNLS